MATSEQSALEVSAGHIDGPSSSRHHQHNRGHSGNHLHQQHHHSSHSQQLHYRQDHHQHHHQQEQPQHSPSQAYHHASRDNNMTEKDGLGSDPMPSSSSASSKDDWQEKGAATAVKKETDESGRVVTSTIRKGVKDFEFGHTLGEGSYSTVVAASDRQTLKEYAVKVLDKRYIIKEKKVKYVHIEKNTLNRLGDHPGIIRLYYTFQDESSLYFVLDYAANGELLSLIKRMGSLNEECTRYYGTQIIDAVDFMHNHGVIHRDLKPENILLDYKMRVKITDFGTAKLLDSIGKDKNGNEIYPKDVRANSFVGTAEYVSPELLSNKATGRGADLWAFGCILYQLIVGKPPFQAVNEYQMFQKIVTLQYSYPDIFPPVLRDLCKHLLVLKPEQRYSVDQVKVHEFFADVDWDRKAIWSQPPPKLQPYRPPPGKVAAIMKANALGQNGSTGNVKASQAAAIALGSKPKQPPQVGSGTGVLTSPPAAAAVAAHVRPVQISLRQNGPPVIQSTNINHTNLTKGGLPQYPPLSKFDQDQPQVSVSQQQQQQQPSQQVQQRQLSQPQQSPQQQQDLGIKAEFNGRAPSAGPSKQHPGQSPTAASARQTVRHVHSLRPMFRHATSSVTLRSRGSQPLPLARTNTSPGGIPNNDSGNEANESTSTEWAALLGSPDEEVLKVGNVTIFSGPPPPGSETGEPEEKEVSRLTKFFTPSVKKKKRILLVTSAARLLIVGEDLRLRTEIQVSGSNVVTREYPFNNKTNNGLFTIEHNGKILSIEDPNGTAEWIEAIDKSKEMYYESTILSSSNAATAATAAAIAVGKQPIVRAESRTDTWQRR